MKTAYRLPVKAIFRIWFKLLFPRLQRMKANKVKYLFPTQQSWVVQGWTGDLLGVWAWLFCLMKDDSSLPHTWVGEGTLPLKGVTKEVAHVNCNMSHHMAELSHSIYSQMGGWETNLYFWQLHYGHNLGVLLRGQNDYWGKLATSTRVCVKHTPFCPLGNASCHMSFYFLKLWWSAN